jgi:phosphoserine aminotransferase
LYRFFEDSILPVTCLVSNPAVRSDTVITIQGSESSIAYIKAITEQHGITLGNGYGAWKNTTFRIANFPAISDLEIDELKEVLSSIATL